MQFIFKKEKYVLFFSVLVLLIFIFCSFVVSAVSDYSDVMLVTNNNSVDSIDISNYFVSMRGITKQCNISVTEVETVTFLYFNNTIRKQIEDCIINNGWNTTINYIVLTKGIPIRFPVNATYREGSVDSALTIILSNYSGIIGNDGNNSLLLDGKVDNPMFNQSVSANKSLFDIYVVTRLDGYTKEDAKRLITPSQINVLNGDILLDRDPTKSGGYLYWDVAINTTNNILKQKKIGTIFNDTVFFITNKTNLFGYVSWGSNDANVPSSNSSTWNLSFVPGSIGETAVSTSGRTFNKSAVSYGQSLVADLIAQNISGIKGYVYEPILWAIAYPNLLFDRYTSGYTLGDSFYMASDYINWMDIVIGDPKLIMINEYYYNWVSNTSIGSVIDVGSYSRPSVFQKDGSWYMLSGEGTSRLNFNGFLYNGIAWVPNSTINNSLPTLGGLVSPCVFQKDGTWYIIAGHGTGSFYGYVYNETDLRWYSNSTIKNGLPTLPAYYAAPSVFQKDGTWYLIAGAYNGRFYGYSWDGTQWVTSLAINASLPSSGAIGNSSTPAVFQKYGTWYMIAGNSLGTYKGYKYNGTDWLLDNLINRSLVKSVTWSAPSVFYKDSNWYVVSGGNSGNFQGFEYLPDYISPTYDQISINNSVEWLLTQFSVSISDNNYLEPDGQYIFSTNNSGEWVNDSAVNFITTPSWANVTKVLSYGVIGYRWFFSDIYGNLNSTLVYVINTVSTMINIVNPSINNALSVYSGQNISIYFNYSYSNFTNITSSVIVRNVKIGEVDANILNQTISISPQFEGFEGSFTPTFWSTGGDALWNKNNTFTVNGSYCAKSGVISNLQKSWLKYSDTLVNDGYISFNWNVSSEADYDYLCYCLDKNCGDDGCTCVWDGVDGTADARISSSADGVWTYGFVNQSVSAGPHFFTWCYATDEGVTKGQNTGIIDNITFTSDIRNDATQRYVENIGWVVNVTVPNFISGKKDLFINTTYLNFVRNDTQVDAIDYGTQWLNYSINENVTTDNINFELNNIFKNNNQAVQVCDYPFNSSNLIGWWTMDDYNETGIIDKSNMNNFAVFRGSAFGISNFTSGHIDEALKFDGNDDYFNITSSNGLNLNNSDFTASFWFRRDGIGACRAYFGKGTGSSTNSGFQIYENCGTYTGQMKYFLGYGSNYYSQYTSTVLQNNTWYFITLVSHNKANMTMYVNGQYDSYVSTPLLTIDYPTNNIYIGRGVWSANYARATLDELMLWNRSFSPEEVSNLFLVQSNERECTVTRQYSGVRELFQSINISAIITKFFAVFKTSNQEIEVCDYEFNTTGLTVWYTMDEYNSTGMFDKSVLNQFGTFGGGLSTSDISSGVIENGILFDGVDDNDCYRIDVQNSTPTNYQNFTSCIWYNPKTSGGYFFGQGDDYNPVYGWHFINSGGKVTITIGHGTNSGNTLGSGCSIDYNDWNFVCLVNNGTNFTQYTYRSSGLCIQTETMVNITYKPSPFDPIRIGVLSNSYAYYPLNGSVDNAMIFNRSLTTDEISSIYNLQSNERECLDTRMLDISRSNNIDITLNNLLQRLLLLDREVYQNTSLDNLVIRRLLLIRNSFDDINIDIITSRIVSMFRNTYQSILIEMLNSRTSSINNQVSEDLNISNINTVSLDFLRSASESLTTEEFIRLLSLIYKNVNTDIIIDDNSDLLKVLFRVIQQDMNINSISTRIKTIIVSINNVLSFDSITSRLTLMILDIENGIQTVVTISHSITTFYTYIFVDIFQNVNINAIVDRTSFIFRDIGQVIEWLFDLFINSETSNPQSPDNGGSTKPGDGFKLPEKVTDFFTKVNAKLILALVTIFMFILSCCYYVYDRYYLTEATKRRKKRTRIVFFIIILLLLIFVITGGICVYYLI